MSLSIVHYNHPILRKKGEKVTAFDPALAKLAAGMVTAMHAAPGIGLAAQQVGRALQLCVIDLREAEADFTWELDGKKLPLDLIMPLIVANPRIKPLAGTEELIYEEGCLSFPKIHGDVVRPDAITATYQDEHGVPHTLRADGLFSRCFQHETDHLIGILFIDRMDKAARAKVDDAIRALAKETREAAKS